MILAVRRQRHAEAVKLQTQLLLQFQRIHAASRKLSQRRAQNGHIRKLFLCQIIGRKINRRIDNTVGLHGMENEPSVLLHLRRNRGRIARQVGKPDMRDRRKRFRAIRLLLKCGKPLLFTDNPAALRLIQCFACFFQRLAFTILTRLSAGQRRLQEHLGGMRVLQHQPAQEILIISRADGGVQRVKHLAEVQARGRIAVIQPAGQNLKLKNQAARHCAVIALTELEFKARKRCLDLLTVKAVFTETGEGIAERSLNGGQIRLAEVLYLQKQDRLHALVVAAERHILGKSLFQNCAAQRRVIAAAEHIAQHLRGEECLRVPVCSDHMAAAELPAAKRILSGRQRVGNSRARRTDRLLYGNLRGRVDGCELRQIFVQQREALVLIDAAVEQQIGVGRMIKPLVRGGKGFIGKIRDGLGIAAGDEAVGRIREQRARHGVYQQLVRVGKRALHLVEHNA